MNSTVELVEALVDDKALAPYTDYRTIFDVAAGLYTVLTEKKIICNVATSACSDGGWEYVCASKKLFWNFIELIAQVLLKSFTVEGS